MQLGTSSRIGFLMHRCTDVCLDIEFDSGRRVGACVVAYALPYIACARHSS
jgi:hypothetical protein